MDRTVLFIALVGYFLYEFIEISHAYNKLLVLAEYLLSICLFLCGWERQAGVTILPAFGNEGTDDVFYCLVVGIHG